jgi:hypothetical protein
MTNDTKAWLKIILITAVLGVLAIMAIDYWLIPTPDGGVQKSHSSTVEVFNPDLTIVKGVQPVEDYLHYLETGK